MGTVGARTLRRYTFKYCEQITLFQHPVNAKMMDPLCNRIGWRWLLSLFQNSKIPKSKVHFHSEFKYECNNQQRVFFGERQSRQRSMFALSFQTRDCTQFEGIWMGFEEKIFTYFRFHLLFIALYYYYSFQMFVVHGSSLKSAQLTGWFFDNCRKHRIFGFRQLCMHLKSVIIEMGMTWMLWVVSLSMPKPPNTYRQEYLWIHSTHYFFFSLPSMPLICWYSHCCMYTVHYQSIVNAVFFRIWNSNACTVKVLKIYSVLDSLNQCSKIQQDDTCNVGNETKNARDCGCISFKCATSEGTKKNSIQPFEWIRANSKWETESGRVWWKKNHSTNGRCIITRLLFFLDNIHYIRDCGVR